MWYQDKQQDGGVYYPCRLCEAAEAMHIGLEPLWDESEVSLIQALEFPPTATKPFSGGRDRLLVDKADLSVYGKDDKWDEQIYKKYIRRRKKRQPRMTPSEERAGYKYLQAILKSAIDQEPPPPSDDDESEGRGFDEDGSVSSLEIPYTQACSQHSCVLPDLSGKKKEKLRPGDVIGYHHIIYCAGDPRGKVTATVLATNPDGHPMLRLDNGQVLPADHQIKRIKIMEKGGQLLTHKGRFRSINMFKMKRRELKGVHNNREQARVNEIIDRNLDELRAEVAAKGLGPTDMIGFGPRRRRKRADDSDVARKSAPAKKTNPRKQKQQTIMDLASSSDDSSVAAVTKRPATKSTPKRSLSSTQKESDAEKGGRKKAAPARPDEFSESDDDDYRFLLNNKTKAPTAAKSVQTAKTTRRDKAKSNAAVRQGDSNGKLDDSDSSDYNRKRRSVLGGQRKKGDDARRNLCFSSDEDSDRKKLPAAKSVLTTNPTRRDAKSKAARRGGSDSELNDSDSSDDDRRPKKAANARLSRDAFSESDDDDHRFSLNNNTKAPPATKRFQTAKNTRKGAKSNPTARQGSSNGVLDDSDSSDYNRKRRSVLGSQRKKGDDGRRRVCSSSDDDSDTKKPAAKNVMATKSTRREAKVKASRRGGSNSELKDSDSSDDNRKRKSVIGTSGGQRGKGADTRRNVCFSSDDNSDIKIPAAAKSVKTAKPTRREAKSKASRRGGSNSELDDSDSSDGDRRPSNAKSSQKDEVKRRKAEGSPPARKPRSRWSRSSDEESRHQSRQDTEPGSGIGTNNRRQINSCNDLHSSSDDERHSRGPTESARPVQGRVDQRKRPMVDSSDCSSDADGLRARHEWKKKVATDSGDVASGPKRRNNVNRAKRKSEDFENTRKPEGKGNRKRSKYQEDDEYELDSSPVVIEIQEDEDELDSKRQKRESVSDDDACSFRNKNDVLGRRGQKEKQGNGFRSINDTRKEAQVKLRFGANGKFRKVRPKNKSDKRKGEEDLDDDSDRKGIKKVPNNKRKAPLSASSGSSDSDDSMLQKPVFAKKGGKKKEGTNGNLPSGNKSSNGSDECSVQKRVKENLMKSKRKAVPLGGRNERIRTGGGHKGQNSPADSGGLLLRKHNSSKKAPRARKKKSELCNGEKPERTGPSQADVNKRIVDIFEKNSEMSEDDVASLASSIQCGGVEPKKSKRSQPETVQEEDSDFLSFDDSDDSTEKSNKPREPSRYASSNRMKTPPENSVCQGNISLTGTPRSAGGRTRHKRLLKQKERRRQTNDSNDSLWNCDEFDHSNQQKPKKRKTRKVEEKKNWMSSDEDDGEESDFEEKSQTQNSCGSISKTNFVDLCKSPGRSSKSEHNRLKPNNRQRKRSHPTNDDIVDSSDEENIRKPKKKNFHVAVTAKKLDEQADVYKETPKRKKHQGAGRGSSSSRRRNTHSGGPPPIINIRSNRDGFDESF